MKNRKAILKITVSLLLCFTAVFSGASPVFADGFESDCTEGIVPGDADANGFANILDAIDIIRYIAGFQTDLNEELADALNDDTINVMDAIYIVKWINKEPGIRLGHNDYTEVVVESQYGPCGVQVLCRRCQCFTFYDIPFDGELDLSYGEKECNYCAVVHESTPVASEAVAKSHGKLKELVMEKGAPLSGGYWPFEHSLKLYDDFQWDDPVEGHRIWVSYYNETHWGETLRLEYIRSDGDVTERYCIYIHVGTDLVGISASRAEGTTEKYATGVLGEGMTAELVKGKTYNAGSTPLNDGELALLQEQTQRFIDSTADELDSVLTEETRVSLAQLGLR